MPNNYVLLDRIELNDTAASVTFDNIPQSGYTDLKIVVSARGNNSNPYCYVSMGFNGVTTNQTTRGLNGTASSASSFSASNFQFFVNGNTSTASTFSNNEFYIPNYRSANNKSSSLDGVFESNSSAADNNYLQFMANLWSQPAAITSVTFTGVTGSFVANSTFSLYGIAQVGTTPAIAPKADGGNVIGTDGTYWYHAFLSNGTFTPQVGLTADVLVVAGGGGGGYSAGGGGGAGGVFTSNSNSFPITNYTVTVGAGGTGSSTEAATGSGTNSSITGLTAAVGGGGGGVRTGGAQISPSTGGSGGGGAGTSSGTPTGAAGTAGQGNAGGSGTVAYSGGGGGGVGSAGANAASAGSGGAGGAGGAGANTWSTWLSATALGVSGFIAGGGGGGAFTYATAGGAGSGGGGAGSNSTNGSNGVVNTGGGAGGGKNASSGGNGGSGLVIIRYPV
jgi:hypothetical protein